MLFSSLIFIFIFLPSVLLVNYILPVKLRNYFLLVASLFFYAWGEPKFVIVMITSICVNYILAILISKYRDKKKLILITGIVFNFGLLFIFKYLNFTISNIDMIFQDLIPQTNITLPIGISFFTFQAVSYVIDVYREDVKVQKNIFYLGLYISFFPQLIAGPIVRYSEIEKQIVNRTTSFKQFSDGVRRFMIGFSKKIIIANNLAVVADSAFSDCSGGNLSFTFAWIGAISFAMQIYFDFGGYSDMAIGIGKMLGFTFSENFLYPYSCNSITGFWKENHISLTSWFKDYVYIPLGGSRVGNIKLIRNLFIVWILTGIWHGANWTFLIWGLIYFFFNSIEKFCNIPKKFKNHFVKIFYRIITLVVLVVCNGVLFKASSIGMAIEYLREMFSFDNILSENTIQYFLEYWFVILFAIIYSAGIFNKIKNWAENNYNKGTYLIEISKIIVYPLLFVWGISYLIIGSHNPFIYFNF